MINNKVLLAIMSFVWLALGCQSIAGLSNSAPPTPSPAIVLGDKPISLFVPARDSVQVKVDEPLPIETYHVNDRPLATLEVLINGQQDFPANLATVQIMVDDLVVPAHSLTPEFPTTNWTVWLLWTGRVPGSYELSVKVKDVDGREGDPIVQRIEVK